MRIPTKKLIACMLMIGFAGAIVAADREPIVVADLGPQVGEQVPDFQLPDQFGQLHNLDSIMGPNGAMLLFHRSADW